LLKDQNTHLEYQGNLRADDSQDKRAPRQVARIIPTGRFTRDVPRVIAAQSRWIVAVCYARQSTFRPRQDTNCNKRSDEENIQQHPYPSQYAAPRVRALLDTAQERGDECVQDGGGENAFDGAVGSVDAATGLDGVDEAVDLVETRGEDAEGDHCGEELQDAREAEEPAIEGAVLELIGDPSGEKARLVAFVVDGTISGTVVREATVVVRVASGAHYGSWD
jgi:hypothetical protein